MREFVFGHRKLDVYRVAVEFVRFVEGIDARCWRGSVDRRKQLVRAADSVVLNIAEGSARGPGAASRNHFRIALGSAGECDAVLELLEIRGAAVGRGRALLSKVGAMLCRMG